MLYWPIIGTVVAAIIGCILTGKLIILSILLSFLAAAVIGCIIVNKQGNYETKWGALMYVGAFGTLISSVASIILFIVALL